jgi:hypothetical protein
MASKFITAPSCEYTLYMAGSYDHAMHLLQSYVTRGECVSVTATDYVYKYGMESGFAVKLINYPRFPRDPDTLLDAITNIADFLLEELGQGSYTITSPGTTYFYDRRED